MTAAWRAHPEVIAVSLIGSVARAPWKEVPRFAPYRRARVALWHECTDLDLALWLDHLDSLDALRRARAQALRTLWNEASIGIASHQVDVFILEPGTDRYLGRLCDFNACPKGKAECRVPGCGDVALLRQHEGFRWRPESLAEGCAVRLRGWRMNDFKGRHFGGEIVLWAVRWYCRYAVSYRDLEAMMTERGVAVDHCTIYRWVQRFAPEMEKRLRWQWRRPRSRSWRIDETYVRVRGRWAYLYRAVDKLGNTIDFYLSSTRNTKAAKRFLGKALKGLKDWELPEVLNTDKAPTYAGAIAELKAAGKCPKDTRHRQVKYLNNVIEADHGKLKQLIRPVRGFKTLKTAYATIKGFEVMRALRKGQASIFAIQGGIVGEARIVERAFGVGPCALTEAMALLQDHLASADS